MISESELRRENVQLQDEKNLLELRLENRVLKQQIKRLEAGKSLSSLSNFQLFLLTIYGISLITLGVLCGILIGEIAGDVLQKPFHS